MDKTQFCAAGAPTNAQKQAVAAAETVRRAVLTTGSGVTVFYKTWIKTNSSKELKVYAKSLKNWKKKLIDTQKTPEFNAKT